MFYLQKIHSQVSRMGKSTACLRPWGYAPCVTAKLPVLRPWVLEPHFAQSCGRFLLLYCILWVAEFAASILSLEDAKCEIASLSNTCGLHMFKTVEQEWSNLLSGPVKTGEQSFAMAAMGTF